MKPLSHVYCSRCKLWRWLDPFGAVICGHDESLLTAEQFKRMTEAYIKDFVEGIWTSSA